MQVQTVTRLFQCADLGDVAGEVPLPADALEAIKLYLESTSRPALPPAARMSHWWWTYPAQASFSPIGRSTRSSKRCVVGWRTASRLIIPICQAADRFWIDALAQAYLGEPPDQPWCW